MNERIKQLALQSQKVIWSADGNVTELTDLDIEKFAELIVQDCANFVRETYDHEAAESIAWTMEINYGLHGDYA